ncbi:hypothetical protein K503DRAFT_787110 [Rhizopogon vinicolor AM-OR11-026]|uniref:F-box domain-containing protein n=1 Tax=Rhizopogon vinicolor AM-OR11-026 TaxID=1314800 RepID=A0A1B7MJ22_9AGAM|nr:hypothetical protein K503DRAFT_787110 [Rhizopogon vinicolor AM-OR11-026]
MCLTDMALRKLVKRLMCSVGEQLLSGTLPSHSGTPNYKLLKACARVCRTWSGHAQSLLFRSVKLGNIHAFHAALLSSETRGRALGNCVQTLNMSIVRYNSYSSCLSTVAKILQACPQVYKLVLGLYGVDLEEEILEKLRVSGQGLKALSLAYYGTQSPILYQLLGIWPNIQVFKIASSMFPSLPWDITTPPPPLQNNADDNGEWAQRYGAEICLYDLVLSFTPTPEALTWLLASSADSLRILEVRESISPTELNVLARHAPRLRSLCLGFYNDNSVTLLRMCTAIEELIIYGLDLPPRCSLAPNLPPTIEYLSLRIQNDSHRTTLQPVIDTVDALPNLKVLTCNRHVRRHHYDEYAMLESRCRIKGVEVVLSDALGRTTEWDCSSRAEYEKWRFGEEGRRTIEWKRRARDENFWRQLE